MKVQNQPTKEQVRHYLTSRRSQKSPPPSIVEIRRQLGWGFTAVPVDGGRGDGYGR
jgi:hypothetical protein